MIRYNQLANGYYILKEFALSTEKKFLGYFILAELALVEKKFNIAKKRYKKLLGQFEPEWLIYNRLGDIDLAEGNNEKAEYNYLKAKELNPDDFDTIVDLIRTYTLNGDIKKAKINYFAEKGIYDCVKMKSKEACEPVWVTRSVCIIVRS